MRVKFIIFGLFFSVILNATNYGFVVGCCRNYKDITLNGLRGISNDVNSFRRVLLERECSPNNIVTLTNRNATKRNIKRELSKLEKRLKRGDRLYFYFSGHGARATDRKEVFLSDIKGDSDVYKRLNRTALITYDYDDKRRYDSSIISYDDLRPIFKRLDKRGVDIVMFVDACFAGKSYKRANPNLNNREKLLDIAISTGSKKPKDSEIYKSLIFFGASLNSLQARDTPNGGEFTNHLIYCFNREETDKNRDGVINKSELQKCMIDAYPNYAREASIYPTNRLKSKYIIKAPLSLSNSSSLIKIKYSGGENLAGIAKRVESGYELELLKNGNSIDIYHIGKLYASIDSRYLTKYLKAYRLFSLKGKSDNVKIDYFSEETKKVEDTFCAGEIIKIGAKNLGNRDITVLTLDREGRVIILENEKDNSVRTEVLAPYGIDRVKVFTYNNPKIFQKTLKYQGKNRGILSSLEVEELYNLFSNEQSLKTQGFEIRTTSTNIKECIKGERQ